MPLLVDRWRSMFKHCGVERNYYNFPFPLKISTEIVIQLIIYIEGNATFMRKKVKLSLKAKKGVIITSREEGKFERNMQKEKG